MNKMIDTIAEFNGRAVRLTLLILPVLCLSLLLCSCSSVMSKKVYKKLNEAEELIEAKNYQKGLAILRELELQKGLSSYEKAQVYNYFAYTYFILERYEDSIHSYEKVLQQADLPEELVQNSLYTLAQLYFIQKIYLMAVETIEKWFTLTPKHTVNAYMLLGQGYYLLEQYKNSTVPLKRVHEIVTKRGNKPKENLLLLQRVNYHHLKDYENMVKVLQDLVELYPKKEYWLTLAAAYAQLKQYDKQKEIIDMLKNRGIELAPGDGQSLGAPREHATITINKIELQ